MTLLKTQRTIGGTATHRGNRSAFCDLMIKQSIRDFNKMLPIKSSVFFDRGIPDLYRYSKRFCNQVTEEIQQAVKDYRYNPTAFIFPPWFEIYSHDTERDQDFQEAIEAYEAVREAHLACGYKLIEVPKMTIIDRCVFILQNIECKEQAI